MERCEMLEHIRLRCFKMILKLNTKTPNYVVLGETGKFNISSIIKNRMLNFWIKIATGKSNRISRIVYNLLLKENLFEKCKWSSTIKLHIDQLGLSYMWLEQHIFDIRMLKTIFKKKCKRKKIARERTRRRVDEKEWREVSMNRLRTRMVVTHS